jgi:hypothetical protein
MTSKRGLCVPTLSLRGDSVPSQRHGFLAVAGGCFRLRNGSDRPVLPGDHRPTLLAPWTTELHTAGGGNRGRIALNRRRFRRLHLCSTRPVDRWTD